MSDKQARQLTLCYHCGNECQTIIRKEEKTFCCSGCQTVYELLQENNLCSYYDMNAAPGSTVQPQQYSNKFAYLDDESVKAKLIQFSDGNISTVTFYVPSMHCSSCIFLLENLYKLKDGIKRSKVNFLKREANLVFDHTKVSLRQLVELMASIGYEPHINLNDLERKEKKDHLQRYYLKIGVAFFAFGNVMLLSFPEYLGIDVLTESPYRKFFGYLNFLIALPVMFYCAEEFFVSAWGAIKQKTLNMDIPIALGIIVMFARSSYEIFSHTGAGYFDTLASLVLLMLVGRLFQNKTYDTLSFERDYKSYFPVAVSVVNNGKETTIPLTKLRSGDRLLIRNMELIPADAVLLKGKGNIDYSFVTGESVPVSKQSGDMIYAGGRHIGAAIEIEAIKDVSHSYLTQLWNDAAFNKKEAEYVTTLASKVSRWFTPVVILIAIVAMLFWWGTDVPRAINAFTAVLIITCPCALALSSPFTLGNVLRILSQRKIYLKNAGVVEKLARINTIVFDKTGTLTNVQDARIEFAGNALTDYERQLVKSVVFHSTHPLSRKIYTHLEEFDVIPTHDIVETEGKGVDGWIDEHFIRVGSKSFVVQDTQITDGSDLRHASKIYVAIDGVVKGHFIVRNEYRKGFTTLLQQLRKRFAIYILSGDNDSEKNFLKQYADEDKLIFHQQPDDKLSYIRRLQQQGKQVLMMGDGLNDAGALRQADVGIAISDDVNNFSPACDGIIESANFEDFGTIMQYAHDGVRIIKISFAISLLYNVVGVYFAVQGTMSPLVAAILMPVSSATIILFTTLASRYAAYKRNL